MMFAAIPLLVAERSILLMAELEREEGLHVPEVDAAAGGGMMFTAIPMLVAERSILLMAEQERKEGLRVQQAEEEAGGGMMFAPIPLLAEQELREALCVPVDAEDE